MILTEINSHLENIYKVLHVLRERLDKLSVPPQVIYVNPATILPNTGPATQPSYRPYEITCGTLGDGFATTNNPAGSCAGYAPAPRGERVECDEVPF